MLYQLSYASPHRLFPARTAASPGERPFKRKSSTAVKPSQCAKAILMRAAVRAFSVIAWSAEFSSARLFRQEKPQEQSLDDLNLYRKFSTGKSSSLPDRFVTSQPVYSRCFLLFSS